jgi:carbon monoxide dehydrogenase subunit G
MRLDQSFEVTAPIDQVWAALIDVERVAPCLPGAAVTGRNEDGSYSGTFTVKIGPTSASYIGTLKLLEVDERAHKAGMHAHGTDKRGQGGADATIISNLTEIDTDPAHPRTHIDVTTDYRITGKLARFGRGGMIEDISQKLLRQFAASLQATLTAEPPKGSNGTTAAAAQADPARAETAGAETAGAETAGAETAGAGSAAPEPAADPAGGTVRSTPPPAATPNEISGLSLLGSVLLDRLKRNPLPAAAVVLTLLLLLLRANRGQAAR